jgi:hypothetical protein
MGSRNDPRGIASRIESTTTTTATARGIERRDVASRRNARKNRRADATRAARRESEAVDGESW